MTDIGFNPIGAHAKDTTVSSATELTPPTDATKLLLQCTGQNIRYVLDGSTPDSTTGFQMTAGDPPLMIPIKAGQTIKVIEEAASATIQYQWGN